MAIGLVLGLSRGSHAEGLQSQPLIPLVQFENGILSVSAQNANLQDILTAIGRASGVEIELHGTEGHQRVSQTIVARPLADGLTELLNGRNYLLLYTGHGKDKRVSKVILSSGSSDQPSGPSAPVTAYAPEPPHQPAPEPPPASRPAVDEPRQPIGQDQPGTAGGPPSSPPAPSPAEAAQPTGVAPIQPSSPFPYLNAIQQQNQARQAQQKAASPVPPDNQ